MDEKDVVSGDGDGRRWEEKIRSTSQETEELLESSLVQLWHF